MLKEECQLMIKARDKPFLHISRFSNCIIHDSFIINKSTIFYIKEKYAHSNGILDKEDLSQVPITNRNDEEI